jgi:flagellar protein FlgJ
MSISIGSDSQYLSQAGMISSNTKADNLEASLKKEDATDEELMDACKSFESYLLEQVFKGMEKTVLKSDEEENDYVSQFKDMYYEEYAEDATENQGLGIAQMLYESMKRNS